MYTLVTVHSVTNNSSVFNAECTHFAKIMQNGAVKLGFLTKNLSKILESGVCVKSNVNSAFILTIPKLTIDLTVYLL